MALELSSIVFKASTDELDAAVKKIETLGKSVEGLASSLGKLDKSSAATNKTQAQANLLNAKAEKELAKAIDITDKTTAATEKLTKATKERQSVEERQAAITRLMAEGNSRGQASILATAEALGEATEKTNEYLKAQRAMSSNNPFDRSLGAATVFANELKVATVASDLYNKDLGFTKNQLQELGREHVRLTEQFKVQGKSLSGLDAEFNKIVQSAQQVTQAENAMATSMKNGQKATIDAGKANAYIENELQKVRFALQANNDELNRSTANSLVKFENNLKKSGLTLDQQKLKIDEYRKAQIELQKTQSANKTDYITRAVGPQITDIIVGLSTGQSPLTVMMQQGGQLRDQFGMMGIAAKDMGDVMRNAMKGMGQSVFDTGKAITTMLAGGMFDAGKAVVNYASSFLFVDKAMEKMRENIIGMSKDFDTATENLAKFDKVAGGIGKVFAFGVLALITTLAAVGVAAVQNIKLMNELSQTLVSVGASYGLTSSQVVEYANAISGAGISTQGSIAAMTLMVKAGAGTAESLQSITLAAMELEKAGGQSVEATSKMYADLAKDPVKALSELRINTGLVTEANMENITSLVEQGREIDAVREAGLIMTDALTRSTKLLYNDMSPLQQLWIDMKGSLTDVWNGVNDLATSSGVVIAFRVVWESVALVIKGVFNTIKGLSTAIIAVMHNDWAGAVDILKETFGTVADNYTDATEAVSKTTEAMTSGVKVQTEAVKKAQEQSLAEKERLLIASALKDTKEKDEKLNAKTLSQSEFITKALEAKNKLLGQNNKLEGENLAMVVRVADAEWKALQPKEKKAKLSDEQKKENKALEDYIDLMNKAAGLNKDYNNILDSLQLKKKNGTLTEEAYVKAVEELIKQQKFYTDGLAQEEKAQKAAQKAAEDHMKLVEEFTKIQTEFTATSLKNQEGIQQENSALKLRGDLLGKTAEEQKKINENYKIQGDISKINAKYDKERLELQQKYLKLQADGFDVDYDTWNAQINESVRQQGEEAKLVWAGVAMSAAESMQNEFQKSFDTIKSSITDVIVTALFDGGKAGSKKLRDQVVAAFRNKITVVIDAVVNTALSGGMNALGIGKGAGGLMGGVGTAANLYSIGSATLGGLSSGATSLGGILSATGASVGTAATYGTAIGSAQTAMLAAQEAGMGLAGAANGITAALGSIPVWGWLAMGGLALAGALQGGETRSGGQYMSTSTASASLVSGPSGGEINGAVARQMLDVTQIGINAMFKAVGSTATIAAFTAGLESSTAGKGFAYAGGTLSTGAKFGDLNSYMNNRGDKTPEEAMAAYKTELLQATIGALKAATDVPKTIQNIIGDTDISTLTESAATALMTQISTIITSVDSLKSALIVLPFEYLKDLSFDAAGGLIAAAGGLETLSNNLSGFYDNFYTETEKTTNLTNNTSKAFAALGIVMPEINQSTREWYRSEVERLGAMDLSVESNAKAYASVLGLQGAVNTLAPAFDSVGTSVSDLAESARQAAATMVSSWASIMQARGVSSSDVTRFTAQADINAAFTQFKTTDKFGIKSAEQFQTITQDDFKNYTAEQQKLISTILVGFRSLSDANAETVKDVTAVNASYTPYVEAIKEVQPEVDKAIQATADYQMAIWEATGDTASAATRQRELATATKLAAGWTQSQIDNLYGAQEAAVALQKQKEQTTLATQATADYQLAIWEATGDTASAAIRQRELATATKLAAGWTQSQIDNLYGAQEAAEAKAKTDAGIKAADEQRASNSSTLLSILADTAALTNDVVLAESMLNLQRVKQLIELRKADPSGELANATFNLWELQDAAKATADLKAKEDARTKVQSDFGRALLDAAGNSSGLAEFDRRLSDAALVAAGWTEAQVQAVNATRADTEAKTKADADLKAQVQIQSDYNKALLEASGDSSGLDAFNQRLSDAALIAAGWTDAQVQAVNAAKEKTKADADLKAQVQIQSDYTRALLEASGDSSGLAAFDRKLSDAALVAAGWTQVQIDAVNTTRASTEAKAKADALIQVQSDYNRALLEASGDTSGLAEFDRKLSDAALIAAGWTQTQVDAIGTARAITEAKAKADALVQVQSDYSRALLEASGDTSGLAEFDRKLSDAALITSGWTASMVLAVNEARTKAEADLKLKEQAQVQSDYNRALLEASNDSSGLAAFDRKLSDAALVAAGWTDAQVQAVNAARLKTEADTKAQEALKAWGTTMQSLADIKSGLQVDLMTAQGRTGDAEALRRQLDLSPMTVGTSGTESMAITDAYDFNNELRKQIATANANKDLSNQLSILLGTQTERTIALGSATDATTIALMKQVWVQQDAKAQADERAGLTNQLLQIQGKTSELRNREILGINASNRALQRRIWALQDEAQAQSVFDAASSAITQNYITANQELAQAQSAITELTNQSTDSMRGFSESIRDFLKSLETTALGSSSPESRYRALQTEFGTVSRAASTGDVNALGKLTGVASDFLNSSKEYFATGTGFIMDESMVKRVLGGIQLSTGRAGAAALQEQDPAAKAQLDLARAMASVANANEMIRVTGVTTSVATTDLLADFRKAQENLLLAQEEAKMWKAADDLLQLNQTTAVTDTALAITEVLNPTTTNIDVGVTTLNSTLTVSNNYLAAIQMSSESNSKNSKDAYVVLEALNVQLVELNAKNAFLNSEVSSLRSKVTSMESNQRLSASAPVPVQ